jgi:hypothetical protein
MIIELDELTFKTPKRRYKYRFIQNAKNSFNPWLENVIKSCKKHNTG